MFAATSLMPSGIATFSTTRRCDGATVGRCAGHKGVERVGEGEGGSMVKKTAISQAKSSITSEHTRNTCGD